MDFDPWYLFWFVVIGLYILNKIDDRAESKRIRRKNEMEDLEKTTEKIRKEMAEMTEKEKKRKEIDKEINDLISSITKDWNASIYADKVKTPGNGHVTYRFENGDHILFTGKTLIYTTSKHKMQFTLGIMYQSVFRKFFNRIVEIINSGKTSTRSSYSKSYSNYSGGQVPPPQNPKPSSSLDPKTRRYEVLMETIRLRKENLDKMSKNDPEREALENELKVAEKKAAEMKNNK